MGDSIKIYTVDKPYLHTKCGLGEAPHWEESHNTLRFVDVVKRQVHYVDLNKGPESHRVQQYMFSFGVTGDIEGDDERFIFAGKHGFGIANRQTGEWKYIKPAWTEEEMNEGKDSKFRANDGGIDPQGRFWATWMKEPLVNEPDGGGVLMCLSPDLTLKTHIQDLTIPNGTRWSPSQKHFYIADSPTQKILRYDFNGVDGTITNPHDFFSVPKDDLPGDGVPDGHCIDEHGNLWLAVHGRGKVLQISPEGKVLSEARLPTRCVTCPVFVGDDLYVTSMEDGNPGDEKEHAESKRLAGALFKVEGVGVRGMKSFKFRLAQGVQLPKV